MVKAPRDPDWHACHYKTFKILIILSEKWSHDKICPYFRTKIANVGVFEIHESLDRNGIIFATVKQVKDKVETKLLVPRQKKQKEEGDDCSKFWKCIYQGSCSDNHSSTVSMGVTIALLI
jgi:hypothetical protein